MVFSFYLHVLGIEEFASDVSMSDERATDESEVEVCPGLLGLCRQIFEYTRDDHIDHVGQLLRYPQDSDVTFNLKRCKYFSNCIAYLGHLIRSGRLKVSTRTIHALRWFQIPTLVTEHRPFLGLYIIFRPSGLNFACVAVSLTKKILQGSLHTFDALGDDEISALDTIKPKLVKLMCGLFHVRKARIQ